MSDEDLTGKLVRWECGGQWLTARVVGTGVARGSWRGVVVDPGTYIGLSMFAPKEPRRPGDVLPCLRVEQCTVIEEEVSSDVG